MRLPFGLCIIPCPSRVLVLAGWALEFGQLLRRDSHRICGLKAMPYPDRVLILVGSTLSFGNHQGAIYIKSVFRRLYD